MQPHNRLPRPVGPMRLLRLWSLHARMDLLWVTRGWKLFLLWTITDTVINVAAITGMLLLAERFAGIGIWSKYQVLFLLGYAALVTGVLDTFFNMNISHISRRIGRGQLDHMLIQPQPLWVGFLTEGFVPLSGSASMLPGIGLMLWAGRALHLNVSIGWLAQLCGLLLSSVAVILGFQYLWGSMAFWAPRAAEEVNSSSLTLMYQLKSFPLDGVGGVLSGSLLTVLPVGFIAWVPCRHLLGMDRSLWGGWSTPLAALLFVALAGALFHRGIKYYGRTGSQRYSSLGHRS